MASINNWLAFSLSPNELSSSHPSDDASTTDCFSISTDQQSQDWNIKCLDFKGSPSDLSMLVGTSSNRSMNNHREVEEPKLEDFLGSHSSSGDYVFSDYNDHKSSIGLSMTSQDKVGCGGQSMLEGVNRKTIDTFGQRTSIYRGVTRHRWTGRYEAHLWDNSCRREGQSRKGRQVYLGGYDKEDKAARAYDLAALKYWGPPTTTNFPVSNYDKELEEMKHMTRQEYVASLRRKSSGFSRGASIYRGVTRHHQHGRWQARIGRVAGNKDLYLGTFSTQEDAAEAYDIAAIKFRGLNAVTNFDMSRYDVKTILQNTALPIAGVAKRLKESSDHSASSIKTLASHNSATISAGVSWPSISFQQPQQNPLSICYHHFANQNGWCNKQEQDLIVPAMNSFLSLQEFGSASLEQGGFMLPVSVNEGSGCFGDDENGKQMEIEKYMGAISYNCYQQLPAVNGDERSGGFSQATMAARAGNVASACHGGPVFSVWNDSYSL